MIYSVYIAGNTGRAILGKRLERGPKLKKMDDMKSWFVTNDIIDFYKLFVEKGFDSVNLIVNHVTKDLIRSQILLNFPD